MEKLPSFVKQGERARLFPVLSESSREGRSLSIILACIENVADFGKAILSDIDISVGARSRIEAYTEVVLEKAGDRACRPDGLIIVRTGNRAWTALVEAKVGNSELSQEQIEKYLEIAKLNGVDAVITVSNQFAAVPAHHPVPVSAASRRKVDLFHWSWMYVLTEAEILLGNDEIKDKSQRVILNELKRFLSHESAGARSFDQMPAAWSDVVNKVQAGGALSANSEETRAVVGAWHQKVRDLSLVLSRQLTCDVVTRLTKAHVIDPSLRVKYDAANLVEQKSLSASFSVPHAAAPIDVQADLQRRSICASMRLRAPGDRKGSKARISWLLRQLPKENVVGLHVRLFWPGRAAASQHSVSDLRSNPEIALRGREAQVVQSFEVFLVRDIASRFSQRRNFIVEVKDLVPDFYNLVGQNLKPWKASAPRMSDERIDADAVSPEAIQQEAESIAMARAE